MMKNLNLTSLQITFNCKRVSEFNYHLRIIIVIIFLIYEIELNIAYQIRVSLYRLWWNSLYMHIGWLNLTENMNNCM